jgi:membrane protein YqaA with SNARE-associated domain
MLLTVALDEPPPLALSSIVIGSLLGGVFGFIASKRVSRVGWVERRLSRWRTPAITQQMQEHPYRWVTIASLTPIAFSWLCYLAGLYRFPRRAFLLLCLLRVPKVGIYFAIVRAGWTHMGP